MAAKIMLVDDYVVQSMGIGNLLEFWGYEMCKQVTSGEEAIKSAESEKPDVILMDIDLHGEKNGIEAAKEIRSRFGIPIIFTTAHSDEETIEAARSADPVDYFVKPLDLYKLKSIIDSIVHKASMNGTARATELFSRN